MLHELYVCLKSVHHEQPIDVVTNHSYNTLLNP